MSTILTKIVYLLLQNQNLCKYIKYIETYDPLLQPDIADTKSELLFKNVFLFPFDDKITDTENLQLRVYSYGGKFNSRTVESNMFVFDILLPNTQEAWLIKNDKIRPFLIMEEIINDLHEKDINLQERLQFLRYDPVNFAKNYNGLRLLAQMVNFTTGKK